MKETSLNKCSHCSQCKNRSGVSETLGIQKNSSLNGPVELGITTLLVKMMMAVMSNGKVVMVRMK